MGTLGTEEFATLILDLRVAVSKVGGGTVGRKYTGDWVYEIRRGSHTGRVLMHGRDLHTGTPKTHAEAAKLAARMYRGI